MNWISIFLAWPVHDYDLILDLPELEFSSFSFSLFVSFSVSPPVQDRAGSPAVVLCRYLFCFPSELNGLFGHVGMSFPRPRWFFGILLAALPAFLPGHHEAMQIVTSLPGHPAWYPGLRVLPQAGWERCPTVCSRLLERSKVLANTRLDDRESIFRSALQPQHPTLVVNKYI